MFGVRAQRQLHNASITAIKRFVSEHRDEEVCCFFFDRDEPRYGHIYISLDSLANNIQTANELERYAIASRLKTLQGADTWHWAKSASGLS